MKVIEAMAYGRPVVSTPLGAEGLPVEAGVHFHRASDANAFAEVLVRLAGELGGPDPRVLQMLDAAREAVAPLFWDSIVRDLVQLYEQGCDRIARLRAT
jgi:glycosyltransferase involved in cell wall biosynthesis